MEVSGPVAFLVTSEWRLVNEKGRYMIWRPAHMEVNEKEVEETQIASCRVCMKAAKLNKTIVYPLGIPSPLCGKERGSVDLFRRCKEI